MAERRIIWSHKAKIKLKDILDYYINRNRSNRYSQQLYNTFQKQLKLLIAQPPDPGISASLHRV
jgi:plasmid stabilization system protein ParE